MGHPCETFLRWWECNGVDYAVCPICETDNEKEEARKHDQGRAEETAPQLQRPEG
jgi:hypothetical protein